MRLLLLKLRGLAYGLAPFTLALAATEEGDDAAANKAEPLPTLVTTADRIDKAEVAVVAVGVKRLLLLLLLLLLVVVVQLLLGASEEEVSTTVPREAR